MFLEKLTQPDAAIRAGALLLQNLRLSFSASSIARITSGSRQSWSMRKPASFCWISRDRRVRICFEERADTVE